MRRSLPRILAPLPLFFFLGTGAVGCRESAETQAAPPPAAGTEGSQQPLEVPPQAVRWVNEGVAVYRQGRYLEAAAAFEKARDLAPANVRVSNLLGAALLQGKRHAAAQAEFRRILALRPEAVEPRLGLARIGIRLGEYDSAAALLGEVLSRDPENPQALYNLGVIRYRAGDYREARDLLGRLLNRKPDHPEGHYTLGMTYLRLGDHAKAEAELRRVVALAPSNAQAHFNLASLYARTGRLREAEKEQEIYRGLADRMFAYRAAEGKSRDLFLAGDYAGALKEYDRLLQANPDSGRFHLGRAQCFLKMGKREEAIAAFEKAASLDPRMPDAHYFLAVLYQQKGELEKSERERRAFEALEAIGENKTGF